MRCAEKIAMKLLIIFNLICVSLVLGGCASQDKPARVALSHHREAEVLVRDSSTLSYVANTQ